MVAPRYGGPSHREVLGKFTRQRDRRRQRRVRGTSYRVALLEATFAAAAPVQRIHTHVYQQKT